MHYLNALIIPHAIMWEHVTLLLKGALAMMDSRVSIARHLHALMPHNAIIREHVLLKSASALLELLLIVPN